MNANFRAWLAGLSVLAAVLVVAMLAIFLATGIGQDPLQFVRPVAEYNALLLRNPAMLRAAVGMDNLFLVAYSAIFVLLARELWVQHESRWLVGMGGGLLLLTGLLDMAENFHFLTMLAGAEQGRLPIEAEIAWQAWESMFKFHVSYLGLLLLGLGLPRHTMAWRNLSRLLCFVQWPVGVAIYVAPHAVAVPLVFARFAFFLASFALLSWIYRVRSMNPVLEPTAVS